MGLLLIVVAVVLLILGTKKTAAASAGDSSGDGVSGPDVLSEVADAVAHIESGNRQTDANGNIIRSSAGALGVMQLMPGTAASLGVDPYNEDENRAGGTYYLSQLKQQFGTWADALAAYNWGPSNVNNLQAGADYPASVQQYIDSVSAQMGGLPDGSS